jgi:hypothetical protein
MANLGDIVEYFENYVNALEQAVERAISSAPMLIRQEFAAQARKHLKTSIEEYMASLDIKLSDNVLIVELDKSSWLANAVESGTNEFDMKNMLANSPKAKISKKGYRYMSIPLPMYKDKGPISGTNKAQLLQEKIRAALKDPAFSAPKISQGRDGSVMAVERLLTSDPALKGMIRTSSFGSMQDLSTGKRPRNVQYTLFRTMSQNPLSKSQWIHPGIKPRKLFPRVQNFADSTLVDLLQDIIQNEMEDFLKGR